MPHSPTPRLIYLDHAATTAADPLVIDAVAESMRTNPANPSAAYSLAGNARKAMRLARQTLSRMIGCDHNELFFTSGGTEANNWSFCGLENRHVILSAIEHSSVLEAARNHHCEITLIKPDAEGIIHPEVIENAIRPDTAMISVQFANNETGALQPVEQIGSLARKRKILFHCDAVQAVGHVPVNVRKNAIDLLSASAHKLYGPRGIGFLYIRSGVRLPPLLSGGGQENGRRSGTENIPAIEGFRIAAELAMADMETRATKEKQLLQLLMETICMAIPHARFLSRNALRTPGVCAVLLPGLSSETAIAKLDLCGILVSGGAACAAASASPSHVYTAMGLSAEEAACVLRFSVGRHTTEEEIRIAAAEIIRIYKENTCG